MKKIGLLLLALVVALGALGVGYAMWSDTITIDGTVNTGTVDINVTGYSATYVYKTMPDHGCVVSDVPLKDTDNIDYTLVSYAVAAQTLDGTGAPVDDAVTLTYDNLFPGACYCADFTGVYAGTIPVHIYADIDSDNPWLAALYEAGYVGIKYKVNNEEYIGSVVQLHEGDTFWVELCIRIPQDDNKDLDAILSQYGITHDGEGTTQDWLQGQSGSFEATIVAYQWNETYP